MWLLGCLSYDFALEWGSNVLAKGFFVGDCLALFIFEELVVLVKRDEAVIITYQLIVSLSNRVYDVVLEQVLVAVEALLFLLLS